MSVWELSRPTRGPEEFRTLVRLAGELEFAALQLKFDQYASHLGRPARFRRDAGLDDYPVSSLIVMADVLAEQPRVRAVVSFARAIGSSRVVVCDAAPRQDAHGLRERARAVTAVAGDAAREGIAFSLHHHVGHPVMGLDDLAAFFDAAGPEVSLTVDTGHLALAGITDITSLVQAVGDRIDNVHLKDVLDGEFAVVGSGGLDLGQTVRALGSRGYSGPLCIDDESAVELEQALRRARAWIVSQAIRFGSAGA